MKTFTELSTQLAESKDMTFGDANKSSKGMGKAYAKLIGGKTTSDADALFGFLVTKAKTTAASLMSDIDSASPETKQKFRKQWDKMVAAL